MTNSPLERFLQRLSPNGSPSREEAVVAPSSQRETVSAGGVEIRVEGVHKSFDDHVVLDGIDLQVETGEIVAIVGGSGSGKTVLLRHIVGQLRPDQGRVLVADHDLPGAPLVDLTTLDEAAMDRLRTHWAIVFQRNALFTGSVYENIALWFREVKGMKDEAIRPIARRALNAVGFANDPTILDKDRDELSGGMAKRVAVARALAMDPVLIFYDEPTAGLDPQRSAEIHDLIHEMHHALRESGGKRTSVIITHDKDLLYRLQPRVVMLHKGQVHFDGPFERFRDAAAHSPIIRPYFETMPILQGDDGR